MNKCEVGFCSDQSWKRGLHDKENAWLASSDASVMSYGSTPADEKKKIYMNSTFRGFYLPFLCHCRNKIVNVAPHYVVHRILLFLDIEDVIIFHDTLGKITSLTPIWEVRTSLHRSSLNVAQQPSLTGFRRNLKINVLFLTIGTYLRP